MSSTVTIRQSKSVGVIGLITLIAGILLIVAGGVTWYAVSDKLAQENITVSDDASFMAGRQVRDPLSAFAQADVINKHALAMSDGKTYAELDKDDPRRETVMNGSFLRASLFTSVVSFGVAALVMGLGVLFILVGWALRRLAGGPPVTVETAVRGAHAKAADTGAAPAADAAARRAATPAEPVAPVVPVTPAPVVPAAEPVDPVRVSRSDRAGTPSPAPAGERLTPPTDASAETTSEKPEGWASPTDRIPPADGTDEPKA